MFRIGAFGAATLVLAACAAGGMPDGGGDPAARCAALFRQFDFAKELSTDRNSLPDGMSVAPGLRSRIAALRQHDCMTRPDDLDLSGDPGAVAEGGASIPPATIHAGVVTDMAAADRARAWFEGRGVKTLSLGEPGLGRRIYIGAFTTQGGRDAALALARSAGFVSPYVIEYGPYMRP
jgi:hypothetical protein